MIAMQQLRLCLVIVARFKRVNSKKAITADNITLSHQGRRFVFNFGSEGVGTKHLILALENVGENMAVVEWLN